MNKILLGIVMMLGLGMTTPALADHVEGALIGGTAGAVIGHQVDGRDGAIVGGILGALLTGVFASPSLGGMGVYDYVANKVNPEYSIGGQVWIQFQGVLTTVIWSGVVAFIAYKIVDVLIGLRVTEEEEREGLDISSHGETAYNR